MLPHDSDRREPCHESKRPYLLLPRSGSVATVLVSTVAYIHPGTTWARIITLTGSGDCPDPSDVDDPAQGGSRMDVNWYSSVRSQSGGAAVPVG